MLGKGRCFGADPASELEGEGRWCGVLTQWVRLHSCTLNNLGIAHRKPTAPCHARTTHACDVVGLLWHEGHESTACDKPSNRLLPRSSFIDKIMSSSSFGSSAPKMVSSSNSLWSGHRLRKAKPAAGGLKDKEQEPLRLALRYLERARSLEHSALRAIVRHASSLLYLTPPAFADLARHV